MKYHIVYDTSKGTMTYCLEPMTAVVAVLMLEKFKIRYLNRDGTPKPYPNRKGHYDISNPRIIPVR